MSADERVESHLDEWEELLAENPQAGFNTFVQSFRVDLDEESLSCLRRKALALAAINQRIDALQDTQSKPSDTANGSVKRLALSELQAGLEPIPGYKLVGRLGAGGFGEVWKAIAPGDIHVALKFVRLGVKAGDIERRSLDVMRDVRHPHLLSVFGTWQQGELLIIATELADRTLLDRHKEAVTAGDKGIPRGELLEYMAEAAKGIDFLNEPGASDRPKIQHRDIKPQNLLLSGGSVKVGDFGLVRAFQFDATATGHTGSMTLAYAAPEFLDGKTSNHSDQYSLAVTYCFLRGGQLPFKGTEVQIIDGHRKHKPDLSMLPESEQPVVGRALSKNPNDRWPSCSAFVEALKSSSKPTPRHSPSGFAGPLHVLNEIPTKTKAVAGVVTATLVLSALLLSLINGNDTTNGNASREANAAQEKEARENPGNLAELLEDFPSSFILFHAETAALGRFAEEKSKYELVARIDTEQYQSVARKLDSILSPLASSSGDATLGLASETARRVDYGILQYGKTAPTALTNAIHKSLGYDPDPKQRAKPEGCIILVGQGFLKTPWGKQDPESLIDYQGGDRVLTVKWYWVSESAAHSLMMAFRKVREIEISVSIGDTPLPRVRPGLYSRDRYDCLISPGGPAGAIFGGGTGGGALNVWAAKGDVNQKFVAKFGAEPGFDSFPMLDAERVLLVMPGFFADGAYSNQVRISDLPPELVTDDNVDQLTIEIQKPEQ